MLYATPSSSPWVISISTHHSLERRSRENKDAPLPLSSIRMEGRNATREWATIQSIATLSIMIKIENVILLLKLRCHENANHIVYLDRISHLTTVFSFFHFFLLSEMKTVSQRHLYDSPYLFHDKTITSFSDSRRH